MASWPWPNDTKDDKLRRIIDSYRTALMEVAPETCRLVDARMVEFGQNWVCSTDPVDVNALMTAAEIAAQFGWARWDIHNWANRHPDRIPKRGMRGNRNLYRVGDVLAYQVSLRR